MLSVPWKGTYIWIMYWMFESMFRVLDKEQWTLEKLKRFSLIGSVYEANGGSMYFFFKFFRTMSIYNNPWPHLWRPRKLHCFLSYFLAANWNSVAIFLLYRLCIRCSVMTVLLSSHIALQWRVSCVPFLQWGYHICLLWGFGWHFPRSSVLYTLP